MGNVCVELGETSFAVLLTYVGVGSVLSNLRTKQSFKHQLVISVIVELA